MVLVLPWWFWRVGWTAASFLSLAGLLAGFAAADCAVDMAQADKFRHKIELLQSNHPRHHPPPPPPPTPYGFLFCAVSHVVANGYVLVLEAGRLYGHARRGQLPRYLLAVRFDWHCGRLPRSREKFRRAELGKFVAFAALTAGLLCQIERPSSARSLRRLLPPR